MVSTTHTHHARDFDFDFARRTLAGIKHGSTYLSPTSANAVLDLDRQPWSNDAASSLVQCGTHSTSVCARVCLPFPALFINLLSCAHTHTHLSHRFPGFIRRLTIQGKRRLHRRNQQQAASRLAVLLKFLLESRLPPAFALACGVVTRSRTAVAYSRHDYIIKQLGP